MEQSQKKPQVYAVASANLATLSIGMCLAWPFTMMSKLYNYEETPLPSIPNYNQGSWIITIIFLGAVVGPLITGLFIDMIGRKYSILLSSIPMIIGWILAAKASTITHIYVARALWGIALGLVFTVVPLYIAEITEKDVRGRLGSFMQIFFVLGLFLTYCVGPNVSYLTFNIIGVFPPIIFVALFYFMPDSPVHLLKRGNRDGAILALKKLRVKSFEGIEAELISIENSLVRNREESTLLISPWLLCNVNGNMKALFISTGLVTFQQLSGLQVLMHLLVPIFALTGIPVSEDACYIILGAVQLFSCSFLAMINDKSSRKKLLITSALGMTFGMILMGLYFFLWFLGSSMNKGSWLPVASLFIFVYSFTLGYGALTWVVVGEIFDFKINTIGSVITNVICWAFAFLISKYFAFIITVIGPYWFFWILASISFIGAVFVYYILPDTKQKTIQEIQDILNNITD